MSPMEIERRLRRIESAAQTLDALERNGNVSLIVSNDEILAAKHAGERVVRLPYLGYLTVQTMGFVPDGIEPFRSLECACRTRFWKWRQASL